MKYSVWVYDETKKVIILRNNSVSEIVSSLGLYHAKPTDWMKATRNDIKKHIKHIHKH